MQSSINTAAQFAKCLPTGSAWDLMSLEAISKAKTQGYCGSLSKMTLSCNGDLETEANGECGSDKQGALNGHADGDCEDKQCTQQGGNSRWYEGGWE